MKLLRFAVIIGCTAMLLTGCQRAGYKKPSTERELYDAGMRLVATMEEMVKSDDYATILSIGTLASVRETVAAGNYDSPTAVYRITPPTTEEIAEMTIGYNPDSDLWNRLSDTLKKQLEKKASFTSILGHINGGQGTEKLAFSSLYTATGTAQAEEQAVLLYVFESGTPIVVQFTDSGAMQGQFCFWEKADTPSDVKTLFAYYNCSVETISVK